MLLSSACASRIGRYPLWSFKRSAAFTQRCLAVLTPMIGLAGCFHPLYSGGSGEGVASELSAIAVNPIPDRLGYYLTNELTFDFNGGGTPAPTKYRLTIALHERVQTPLVDTISGRATSATVEVDAEFSLVENATSRQIANGTAFVTESYDRSSQRFANIRAARDAEIRSAKSLGDQIKTRIAAALSALR